MIKNIIFDFDGTIADSFKSVYKIIGELSQKHLKKKLSIKEIQNLRDLTTREIFSSIGFSIYKIPFVVKKIRKELSTEIEKILPVKGMEKTLIKLKNAKKNIIILSSNEMETIQKFLDKYKMNFFSDIFSGSSLFGKHILLRKILRRYHLEKNETVYIGDETRDVQAAKKTGIKSVAVTWGFNSINILEKQKPDYLVSEPKELLKIFINSKYITPNNP